MNKQRQAVLGLTLMTGLWLLISYFVGEWKGIVIFGSVIVGQLSMAFALWYAQREVRQDALRGRPKKGWFAALALISPMLAHALWPIIIGLAVVIGLGGWAAIKIWSKALDILIKDAKKPAQVAMVSVSEPGIVLAAAAPPEEQEVQFQLAGETPPLPTSLGGWSYQANGIPILVPSHYYLQYSTNMVDWTDIHYSATEKDELTFWYPDGPQGFFRYKAYEVPATTDPTL